MNITDGGRRDFNFDADERAKLVAAANLLGELCNVLKQGHFGELVTGYPEDEVHFSLKEIEDMYRRLNFISEAWAVE